MKWNILHAGQNDDIISSVLANRGITDRKEIERFLNPSREQLDKEFFNTREFKKADERIKNAIARGEQIIIYSDYDVDGITGTAILWETIHEMGGHVMPFVPDRFNHGYGLSVKGIGAVLSAYPETKLVITVDNGITAASEVAYLSEKGIDVIITDHHTIPKKKPEPAALIHTTELSGSGVSYMFSRKIAGRDNDEHLALSAIGTIADLVPLTGVNRVIAHLGLKKLPITKRVGLAALLDVCGLKGERIETYHVGFMIAPRINAAGRLAQGLEALQLLCTKSPKRAYTLATRLNHLNQERQAMMQSVFEHAHAAVSPGNKLLFVSHESYHEGIIGLVAGNLTEKLYRPAIVVSIGKELSKASARSIRGFNIIETIRMASHLLVDAGGHPMAAGFSFKTELLEVLQKELHALFNTHVDDALLEKQLSVDREISLNDVTYELYTKISALKPFGVGNHEPVFVSRDVIISDIRLIGKEGKHIKLKIKTRTGVIDGVGFNMADLYTGITLKQPVDIVYSIMENEWNGKKSLQLKLKDIHA